jgi:hypothetical protein
VTPTVRHTTRHRASTGLGADARNRAARTFLQGLAYTTGLALALVIYNAFQTANGWGGFDWDTLGFAATQAVVTAAFAYIMRAKLDPSGVPTPLPPAPVPAPNNDVPADDIATVTALSTLDDDPTTEDPHGHQ